MGGIRRRSIGLIGLYKAAKTLLHLWIYSNEKFRNDNILLKKAVDNTVGFCRRYIFRAWDVTSYINFNDN